MVRNIIGDTDPNSYDYSDERIQQTIVMAGIFTSEVYDFPYDYTFDIATPEISPDPTALETYDSSAIALWTLKSACILNQNSYMKSAMTGGGIRVKDYETQVDTTGLFTGWRDILDLGPCKSFEKLMQELTIKRRAGQIGRAVFGPATHKDSNFYSGAGCRDFFNEISK